MAQGRHSHSRREGDSTRGKDQTEVRVKQNPGRENMTSYWTLCCELQKSLANNCRPRDSSLRLVLFTVPASWAGTPHSGRKFFHCKSWLHSVEASCIALLLGVGRNHLQNSYPATQAWLSGFPSEFSVEVSIEVNKEFKGILC